MSSVMPVRLSTKTGFTAEEMQEIFGPRPIKPTLKPVIPPEVFQPMKPLPEECSKVLVGPRRMLKFALEDTPQNTSIFDKIERDGDEYIKWQDEMMLRKKEEKPLTVTSQEKINEDKEHFEKVVVTKTVASDIPCDVTTSQSSPQIISLTNASDNEDGVTNGDEPELIAAPEKSESWLNVDIKIAPGTLVALGILSACSFVYIAKKH